MDALFQKPDRRDIPWDDFLMPVAALGTEITEKGGSMISLRLNGRYAVFHKPHASNESYVSDLKRIRRFLQEAGVVGR